jgi:Zn-dependent protease with chaperone function
VLTSGLLNLYAGRPEELRFVVGHELGHDLCGHLELGTRAFGVLAAVRAIDLAAVPDRLQGALPTLGLGRVYTWCRESEVSADRAGLLCCGGPKAAYQAVMRLQHGLSPDSPWVDPEAPDFDAEKLIQGFRQWQYQPLERFPFHSSCCCVHYNGGSTEYQDSSLS